MKLNDLPARTSITEAFKTPGYRILIVAEKYQTGFDEPMLHTMYVDKKLAGLHAVQTLSRLNRVLNGKIDCMILDFVNEAEDIRKAFQDYYQSTILEEASDPNILYDMIRQMEEYEIFFKEDVNAFAQIFFSETEPAEKLQPLLDRVVERFFKVEEDQRECFRLILQRYVRLYGYMSQIITFIEEDLEKHYVFIRCLNLKLPRLDTDIPVEIRDAVDLDSFRIQMIFSNKIELVKTDGYVKANSQERPKQVEDEMEFLSAIIKTLNDTYGFNLTDEDKVDMALLENKLKANEELRTVMLANNSDDGKRMRFEKAFDDLLTGFVYTKLELYKKLTDTKVIGEIKAQWYDHYKRHIEETHRAAGF